ncbi:MAG: elongation factor P maturation arginine rhamnosyltransferase EarP [Burkholderiaceae bacterium]
MRGPSSNTPITAAPATSLWDIFCQVIDNYGDIGVCWRLACNLAQRGQRVRLWVDDASALAWMAPAGCPGVAVHPWPVGKIIGSTFPPPGDVVIEAFGCQLSPEFIATLADSTSASSNNHTINPVWINLEYLSAEPYVERSHLLPSPQKNGLTKHFFYPGFNSSTGGLLREPDLLERQAAFNRAAWLQAHGLAWQGERLISLFCYEPPAIGDLLQQLRSASQRARLLVTPGRAAAAVLQCLNGIQPIQNDRSALQISYLPHLTQTDFDHLLWACDLNFVRGEDSLVRALWAGKPFIWQAYPQQDAAHHAKLAAFLGWLQAPPALADAHNFWNGVTGEATPLAFTEPAALAAAQRCITEACAKLLAQEDLASQLIGFVQVQYQVQSGQVQSKLQGLQRDESPPEST